MKKVTLEITVRIALNIDEGVDLDHVVNELDYNFNDTTTQAEVADTEILGYEIID